MGFLVLLWAAMAMFIAFKFIRAVRMVPNRQAYIIERLGRYHATWKAGFHVSIPFVDRVAYIHDLREVALAVPPQEAFTADNVRVEVDGVIYMSVVDPERASYGVTNYRFAAVQLAQTTTRSVLGTMDLDRTFEDRDLISAKVVEVLAQVSSTWGIQVHRYEVKDLTPPTTVRVAMERQMTAERNRRAMLAEAEAEKRQNINESEGLMESAVQVSEGERQRQINEARGVAEEMLAISQATAESIRMLAASLVMPGAVESTNQELRKQYLNIFGNALGQGDSVMIPATLTEAFALVDHIGIDDETAGSLDSKFGALGFGAASIEAKVQGAAQAPARPALSSRRSDSAASLPSEPSRVRLPGIPPSGDR